MDYKIILQEVLESFNKRHGTDFNININHDIKNELLTAIIIHPIKESDDIYTVIRAVYKYFDFEKEYNTFYKEVLINFLGYLAFAETSSVENEETIMRVISPKDLKSDNKYVAMNSNTHNLTKLKTLTDVYISLIHSGTPLNDIKELTTVLQDKIFTIINTL